MTYLVPEEVAEENHISVTSFVKFLEVHISTVSVTGKMIDETKLRFRIKRNFGEVNENVFKVIIQELELTLDAKRN